MGQISFIGFRGRRIQTRERGRYSAGVGMNRGYTWEAREEEEEVWGKVRKAKGDEERGIYWSCWAVRGGEAMSMRECEGGEWEI